MTNPATAAPYASDYDNVASVKAPDRWTVVYQLKEPNASFLSAADQFNRTVKLLEIKVGDQDFTLAGSKRLAEVLEKRGIKHELQISGGGHTWINWRHYLNELGPRLFQDRPADKAKDKPATQAAPIGSERRERPEQDVARPREQQDAASCTDPGSLRRACPPRTSNRSGQGGKPHPDGASLMSLNPYGFSRR